MREIKISLDENLLEQSLREAGLKYEKDLIGFTLRELFRHKNLKKLLQSNELDKYVAF